MTFIVDSLLPNIRTIVARFSENKFRQYMTFERLIQFEKDEGDVVQSRITKLARTSGAAKTTGTLRPGIIKPSRWASSLAQKLKFVEPVPTCTLQVRECMTRHKPKSCTPYPKAIWLTRSRLPTSRRLYHPLARTY